MTVPELEDALVEFVAMNTSELRYRSNEMTAGVIAPRVYSGFIARNQVGEIIPGDITTYPAIVIRAKQGVQSQEYEKVTVEMLVGCFDDTKDQQGYRDVMQLVERLKQRIREQSVIRQKFPVRLPLNWQVNKRSSSAGGPSSYNEYPYWFGEIQVDFQLPIPATQYDANSLSTDSGVGRYDVPMLEQVEHYENG
jgi:hypothetical protein